MDSFSGNCEIVEVKEQLSSFNHFKGNHQPKSYLTERKSPRREKERKKSVEDDIDKLFEAITLRNSSKGQDLLEQAGVGSSKKSASKRPMRAGRSPPGISFSEPVSLKQALRGLCISQASEMAATKRSSLSLGSPRVSEAGKIASLYRSVVVEAGESGLPLTEGRKGRLEISLVPEEGNSASSEKKQCNLEEPESKSLSPHIHSSPCSAKPNSKNMESVLRQNERIPSAKEDVSPSLKAGSAEEEKHTSLPVVPSYSTNGHASDLNRSVSGPIELSNYQIEYSSSSRNLTSKKTAKLRRKAKLQSFSSSTNAVRKSRRNTPHVAKPVIRRRNFTKKKVKQDSVLVPGTSSASNDIVGNLVHKSSKLICQRCKCSLKDVITESSHISASLSAEVSSSGRNFVAGKPGTSGSNVVKNNMYLRQRDKRELSQSSKSSIGEYSSSTSLSEESNMSGSSCSNRPHMSRDLRWEAINYVQKRHGFLGLKQFNLLKKLGCGDIGTVYLAELIGRRCLFAIKVMDNEYLERRKKMPRAQTEREILTMLDHPFLPTLYTHFVSDNLSCLVMEYCPGGDLHVLRQKQPGRYYPEHAARFYVAEVLLALEYLHMLGVVYRDLKPENILVREDGHIMLTDFDLSLVCSVSPTLLKSPSVGMEPPRLSGPCKGSGCIDPFCAEPSCQVSCFNPRVFPAAAKTRKLKTKVASQVRSLPQLVAEPTDARSNSFVGTHEYLAPEIIKGEGHGSAVDWWTLGIFLYELLFSKTPFKGSGNEETLANVVLQSLIFPDSPLVSFQARDLIRGLLVKEPENRFGYEKGAAEIKQHPFFNGLNWALIRCAVPPQIPDLCDVRIQKSHDSNRKYLDGGAAGEHMDFELF